MDSTITPTDTTFVDDAGPDAIAISDTVRIKTRSFDKATVKQLKEDPELEYTVVPTVAESLWDRFLKWLGQIINSFFSGAVNTNWGKLLTYAIAMVIVAVIVMMLLKVNTIKMLYGADGVETFKHNVLDENIHAMDFERLIQDACAKSDYRLAVRLVFLYSLKMLSDKNFIHWDQGKTNHDYLEELNQVELKNGFNELNYYFEYAWYGHFNINEKMFAHVQLIFNEWRSKLK